MFLVNETISIKGRNKPCCVDQYSVFIIHYITRPAHSKQWPPALASTGGGSSDARDAADWALWHCHRFALHWAALDIGLILEQCFIHGLSGL